MNEETLAMAKAYTDEKCGGSNDTVKTVLYEGVPPKLNLTDYGVGYVYNPAAINLLELAEGMDIHYEYKSGGRTYSGVLDWATENTSFSAVMYMSKDLSATLLFVEALGGTGFVIDSGNGAGKDVGTITLKLWTEYNENDFYFIKATRLTVPDNLPNLHNYVWYAPFSHDRAVLAAKKGLLRFKYIRDRSKMKISNPVSVWWNDDSSSVSHGQLEVCCFDISNTNVDSFMNYHFTDGIITSPSTVGRVT